MRVAIVSCSKDKKEFTCPAEELYSPSEYFRASIEYARAIKANKILILSTEYGIVLPEDIIEYYEKPMECIEDDWASKVKQQLQKICDFGNDEFILLLSKTYYKYFQRVEGIVNYQLPIAELDSREAKIAYMKNMSNILSTPQLSELDVNDENNHALLLHHLFYNNKYEWSDIANIPFKSRSGVYVVFDKHESFHQYPRIVFVGSHKKTGQLQDYLKKESNNYLANNTFFGVVEEFNASRRERLEQAIIATLNKCNDFKKNAKWLGNFSYDNKIEDSGMWLAKNINANTLSSSEFKQLLSK